MLVFVLGMICFTINNLFNNINKINLSNQKLIEFLIDNKNYYKNNKVKDSLIKYIFSSSFGISYQKKEQVIENKTYYVSNIVNTPKVFIYNSHQKEGYSDSNVLVASKYLKEKLNDLEIKSVVLEEDLSEFMLINNYSFASSYKASRIFIEDAIIKYPDINFFIDVHRDSIKKNESTITMNNKKYAKILFVVGLEHNNYRKNLDTANLLNKKIKEKYSSLTRGVLSKSGVGVNGIYNQDVSPNAILIEIGGYQNTISEVKNTIDLIAPILGEYINGKEKES